MAGDPIGQSSLWPPCNPSETSTNGGSIQTKLSANIVLNDASSLHREWIAVHGLGLPCELEGTPGVTTVYVPGRVRGEYDYAARWTLKVTEELTALEVRFICFDVWGERTKALVSTDIMDVSRGQHEFDARWNWFSENECSSYYASIAYVARVRTKDGRVLTADTAPVVEEARRFSAKFSAADLDPDPERR